jgi:toxin-antitoxin system PIN domain toxin
MHVVDTNVLVYAANLDSPWHASCRAALARWRSRSSPWYVTWGIAYEFVRLTSHPRTLEHPWTPAEAWAFLEALAASPGFGVLQESPRHLALARDVAAELPHVRGSAVHDAHVAILMREHGIQRIYTRDTGFHRFPFLEVVDPVAEGGPAGVAEPPARYRPRRPPASARR